MEYGVEKMTIRTTPDIKEMYEDIYPSFYIGAKTAVNVFPFFRNAAIGQIKDKLSPEDFENINNLVTDQYLKDSIMIDAVSMIRCMVAQQEMKKLSIDFEDLKWRVGEIDPIHLYFLFSEIKRYRRIENKVPGYRARQFFKNEL
jgi:hypothetical protein